MSRTCKAVGCSAKGKPVVVTRGGSVRLCDHHALRWSLGDPFPWKERTDDPVERQRLRELRESLRGPKGPAQTPSPDPGMTATQRRRARRLRNREWKRLFDGGAS